MLEKADVTVIIPTHLNENYDYLKACVRSVLASVAVELDVIVISDAPMGRVHFGARVRDYWDQSLNNLTKKWKRGLELAKPETKFVMLISDDVMVSKYAIADLVQVARDQKVILSPASNCDATTRYYTQFWLGMGQGEGMYIPHKCTLEDIQGYEEEVINYPRGPNITLDPGWVSFYCTLFPKTVLQEVGAFDEDLDVRHNDVDYCSRARQRGIPSLIYLGAFALHFGDRTLPKCTPQEEYIRADEAYRKKYGLGVN